MSSWPSSSTRAGAAAVALLVALGAQAPPARADTLEQNFDQARSGPLKLIAPRMKGRSVFAASFRGDSAVSAARMLILGAMRYIESEPSSRRPSEPVEAPADPRGARRGRGDRARCRDSGAGSRRFALWPFDCSARRRSARTRPRPLGAEGGALPLGNWSGGRAALEGVDAALAQALRARGIDVVAGNELEPFLARHRIRYSAGIDAPTALAAGEELGVRGVVVGSLELYARALRRASR